MNKNKNYSINYLSSDFYKDYDNIRYPEIERKDNRPYMVVLVKIGNNTFAIPFRTNVRHNNCYRFKNSTRPTETVTGLDFTKAVVVEKNNYIGNAARINDKEYIELDGKYHFIIEKFKKYVDGYIEYANGQVNEFNEKKYKYTTLKYFHNELGL